MIFGSYGLLCFSAANEIAVKDESAIPYHQKLWLCSHNAMSNLEDAWLFPNQLYTIANQLKRGVHAQMWDVWDLDGKACLRHGNGTIFIPQYTNFEDALKTVKSYLDANRQAIITLILESHVKDELLWDNVVKAELENYVMNKENFSKMLTLGEMSELGQRLIIFSDCETNHFLYLWDHAVETDWANDDVTKMKDQLRRGKKENPLFIVNHFVTNPLPSPECSKLLNKESQILQRLEQLEKMYNKQANFIVLDFVGDQNESQTVEKINALRLQKDEQESASDANS